MTIETLKRFGLMALAMLGVALPAAAQDVGGGKDHPLVGRYQGAVLIEYKTSEFDEMNLMQGPFDKKAFNAPNAPTGSSWLQVEGKVTRLAYRAPEGRSSLEVIRNHENALKAKGFEVKFSCSTGSCYLDPSYAAGVSTLSWAVVTNGQPSFYLDEPVRYSLLATEQPGGTAYVSILVGTRSDATTAWIAVVEPKPLDGDKIVILKAPEIEKAIAGNGKVDIYGILFDFDKADVLAQSKPALDEIAKLLLARPQLKLQIVGHTDGKGGNDHNLSLSQRRAVSVVKVLQAAYGIEPSRLTSAGKGAAQPVAPNDTDFNRARNRRVELIPVGQ
jgi:OmpA-OmpF porin, OOP family